MSEPLAIRPFLRPARGVARVPGSKSVTNRALILAALADGETLLTGALFSRDTRILVTALRELGFDTADDERARTIRVRGLGGKIPARSARLHVGNAGTAARFLTAFLALAPGGRYELDGDEAMRARPMSGLLEALRGAGCRATAPDGGRASGFPFTLETAGGLGALEVDASASSQLLSAILMALPLSPGASVRMRGETVSEPFVEMTARMCAQFGRPLRRTHDGAWTCDAPGAYAAAKEYAVEPDATAASYFLALPAAAPAGSCVRIGGYADGGLQGDTAFARVAEQCGASVRADGGGVIVETWRGVRGGDFDFNAFSDTFLTLATLAALADGPVRIRGIGHTRKQETDRVLAMATELERIGLKVAPSAAALRGDATLSELTVRPDREAMRKAAASGPVRIRTYEDHRMAMSFGVLGCHDLFGDGRPWIEIEDPACTGKTFPDFFPALDALRGRFVRVAVDGGAASGKSSTCRALAARLGLLHVDTGAHYRTVTRALLRRGAKTDDPAGIERLLAGMRAETAVIGLTARLALDGAPPADADLRTPEVTAAVSSVAALPAVRAFLLGHQRAQAETARTGGYAGLVMEGRDIGSVVMPDAEVRIFLEADAAARERRRAAEGMDDAIGRRDLMDSTRTASPLVCPAGALRIDNTALSLDQVVEKVAALVAEAAR